MFISAVKFLKWLIVLTKGMDYSPYSNCIFEFLSKRLFLKRLLRQQ